MYEDEFLDGSLMGIIIIKKLFKTIYVGISRSCLKPFKYQLDIFSREDNTNDYITIHKEIFISLEEATLSYKKAFRKQLGWIFLDFTYYVDRKNAPSLIPVVD